MVHDLAVSIFEELHRSKYQNTPHQGPERALLPDFRHPKYLQSYLYPHGPIELVGYWIETRLFGGVVVFEHGNPPGEVSINPQPLPVFLCILYTCSKVPYFNRTQPGAPWIHFPYEGIMRMSDKQLDAFTQLAFTTSPVSNAAAVSDLLPEPDVQYVDSFDAYEFGLFRNCFEHNPPPNISRFSCTAMGRNVTYPDWVREYLKKSWFLIMVVQVFFIIAVPSILLHPFFICIAVAGQLHTRSFFPKALCVWQRAYHILTPRAS